MGTSPASKEIQKSVQETIKNCKNAITIKDDILVHGKDNNHDKHLIKVLKTLSEKGLTLQKEKWVGNIYIEKRTSLDTEKCKIFRTDQNQHPMQKRKVFYKLCNSMQNFYQKKEMIYLTRNSQSHLEN